MRMILTSLAAVLLIVVTANSPGQTQPAQPLPALIRQAKGAYRPISQADVSGRRSQLVAAADRLDRYLQTGGQNGLNWKRFLRWDAMREQLARGTNADLDALNEIHLLYLSGHVGFEMPVYADVGKALRRYIDALDSFTNRDAQSHYEARIDALADDVEAYLANPATADTHRAGMILGELAASGQAAQVIQAVRQQMSHPNLLVDASEQFIAAGIEDPVNDVGPVTDVILGTRIHGTAQTVGFVNAELGNASRYAAIDILMTGTAYSRTVGYNGPAVIHSTGITGLAGRKRLVVDEFGLRAYPAASNARTRTTITGVGVNANFLAHMIQKIATKRVYQSKAQAEAIAGRRAQTRLNTRMDMQSVSLIAQGNRDFWAKFRNPLLRVGAFPEQLNFSSWGDRLMVRAMRADSYQLGATTSPPPAPAADVSVRFHESTVDNFASTVLAGRTVTRDELNRLVKNMTGKIPEELQDEEGRDWSITFSPEHPIEMAIDDGAVRVTIRGEEFTSGETVYDTPMNISAHYGLERNDRGGLRAVRKGELEIYPPGFRPGVDQLSSSQQSLKTVLERRFTRLFKPEIPDKPTSGLELGGRLKKLGTLPVAALEADGGWLTVGWSKPAAVTPGSGPALVPPVQSASFQLNRQELLAVPR
jgi:hypothetical protein